MVKGRDGVLTQAVWISTLLLTIKIYFFCICFSVIPEHQDLWELLFHPLTKRHGTQSWGKEQNGSGEEGRERRGRHQLGQGLLSPWSGAHLMGEAESTLAMPLVVFSSELPALVCQSWIQPWKLALPRWVWTLEWVCWVEMGGVAKLLKKPKWYLSSRALYCHRCKTAAS